jgi:hypothetical protein
MRKDTEEETALDNQDQQQKNQCPSQVHLLLSLNLDCLGQISLVLEPKFKVQVLKGRLERWSIGLFNKEGLALDAIFKQQADQHSGIRQFILKSLVCIAMAECTATFNCLILPKSPTLLQNDLLHPTISS